MVLQENQYRWVGFLSCFIHGLSFIIPYTEFSMETYGKSTARADKKTDTVYALINVPFMIWIYIYLCNDPCKDSKLIVIKNLLYTTVIATDLIRSLEIESSINGISYTVKFLY